MSIPGDLDGLTALFERLGAREPEGWARSQIEEGIPQLQRFLFLRQAWHNVVRDGDTGRMQDRMERALKRPDEPNAGVGLALRKCLGAGASAQDLDDIVRGMQAALLFDLCDDPMLAEKELSELGWRLFQVDGDDRPAPQRLGGLRESVLEIEAPPIRHWSGSGRHAMRPPSPHD